MTLKQQSTIEIQFKFASKPYLVRVIRGQEIIRALTGQEAEFTMYRSHLYQSADIIYAQIHNYGHFSLWLKKLDIFWLN